MLLSRLKAKLLITKSIFKGKTEHIFICKNEILCRTHSKVEHLYVLESGELEYFHIDEVTEEKTHLFCINRPGMIIGWEVLNIPERFVTSIAIRSASASFVKIEKNDFLKNLSTCLLSSVCKEVEYLLQTSFQKQSKLLRTKVKQRAVQLENYFISQDSTLAERLLLLTSSPFFAEFKEEELTALARLMERREYEVNEFIYNQDEKTKGIFILIQGEVSIGRQEQDVYLGLRSISSPGYLFGWSSALGSLDFCNAQTEHKTSVYFISEERLTSLLEATSFGMGFYKMILWLMGNQLQFSNSKYMYLLDDHNLVSVKHLIDLNRPGIPLPSPLHQIPHLLKDTTTQPLAYKTLHKLNKKGTKQERHLSSICLDLLKGEEREMLFMESIAEVYNAVAAGKNNSGLENRKLCAEKVREVFDHIPLHVEGEQNLPEKGGNIFIYNHLLNHPYYTLNNCFQLTLDSHFISALISDKHYKDPGIRTVRYGKSSEFAHQDYYENLDYIKVYTSDSDLQDTASRLAAKERFYAQANDYLYKGINLIISPEGTSFVSEESPGPFKMGPFNIADKSKKEPLIVPIVFYNFDKRITENLFFCRVLPPFKISEKKKVDESLKAFVMRYQQDFAMEVARASRDAEKILNDSNR